MATIHGGRDNSSEVRALLGNEGIQKSTELIVRGELSYFTTQTKHID